MIHHEWYRVPWLYKNITSRIQPVTSNNTENVDCRWSEIIKCSCNVPLSAIDRQREMHIKLEFCSKEAGKVIGRGKHTTLKWHRPHRSLLTFFVMIFTAHFSCIFLFVHTLTSENVPLQTIHIGNLGRVYEDWVGWARYMWSYDGKFQWPGKSTSLLPS